MDRPSTRAEARLKMSNGRPIAGPWVAVLLRRLPFNV
jgi:hypothetical protein